METMSQTSPTLNTVCMDLGNGYTKITHPSEGDIKIPAYVLSCDRDPLVASSATSYHTEIEGKGVLVGSGAQFTGKAQSMATTDKHLYYPHFLMSLFAGYERGVDHITINQLLVTRQPNGKPCQSAVDALQDSTIEGKFEGRNVKIKIKSVLGVDETRATGKLILTNHQPQANFAIVNLGKGTFHFQQFDRSGQPGKLATNQGNLGRMEDLKELVQQQWNNLSPDCEALSVALERGASQVFVGSKPIELEPLLAQLYKTQARKMKGVEKFCKQADIKTVFVVGGGSHMLKEWKPEGIKIERKIKGCKDRQFTELEGLKLIAEAV